KLDSLAIQACCESSLPLKSGRPSAPSSAESAPSTSALQPWSPKSAWASEKSRKITGTRRMHSPSMLSQLDSDVHVKPLSTVQLDEQPSPSSVLPSSPSSSIKRPSPQSEVHESPSQLGSRRHCAEQPSNGRVLPSSHASAPS